MNEDHMPGHQRHNHGLDTLPRSTLNADLATRKRPPATSPRLPGIADTAPEREREAEPSRSPASRPATLGNHRAQASPYPPARDCPQHEAMHGKHLDRPPSGTPLQHDRCLLRQRSDPAIAAPREAPDHTTRPNHGNGSLRPTAGPCQAAAFGHAGRGDRRTPARRPGFPDRLLP
jgi:hypothetical protein